MCTRSAKAPPCSKANCASASQLAPGARSTNARGMAMALTCLSSGIYVLDSVLQPTHNLLLYRVDAPIASVTPGLGREGQALKHGHVGQRAVDYFPFLARKP